MEISAILSRYPGYSWLGPERYLIIKLNANNKSLASQDGKWNIGKKDQFEVFIKIKFLEIYVDLIQDQRSKYFILNMTLLIHGYFIISLNNC